MKLSDFATKLTAKNHFIKASFGGFAGSGKTRTATEFIIGAVKDLKIEAPVLIIDNEKGSRFLEPIFKQHGINVIIKDTIQLADVLQAFQFLNSGEVGFLFMDSLSKIWYKYVRDYREKNRRSFMTLQDWGKILPAWQEAFSDEFVNLNGNCVFTGRGGYTYDMEENEETKKKEFTKSGVKMKLAGETPFEPDINVWMELCQEMQDNHAVVWREAQILKDRSGLIDGKTFKNPTYADFKPVVSFLTGIPIGNVAGASDTKNMAPSENYDELNRRQQKEIVMEKLKALFDKHGFGTSKEDKQYKIMIFEKFFGTASATELEKQPYEFLDKCHSNLVDFFAYWNDAKDKAEYIKNYVIKASIL